MSEEATAESRKAFHLAAVIGAIVAVGWIDYLTEEYFSLALFYLLIIGYTTWFLGRFAANVIAVFCVAVGLAGDLELHHAQLSPWSPYWNGLIQLIIYLAAVQVLTQLKRALERERIARAEIAERNRLLEEYNRRKDEYLAVCSHDLRSPIVSLYAGCKVLLGERMGALTAAQRDVLMRSMNTSQTVLRLIDTLLDLARIEEGKEELCRERCDLAQLVEESIGLHQESAKARKVFLEFRCASRPATVCVDRLKMLRVCNNLISNAVKHSPPSTAVRVHLEIADGRGMLSVADEGPGLSPEEIKVVFDRFGALSRKKKTRSEGTGLGLSISRSLVQLHGGRLEVDSEKGRGSIFRLILPMAGQEAKPSSPAAGAEVSIRAAEKVPS